MSGDTLQTIQHVLDVFDRTMARQAGIIAHVLQSNEDRLKLQAALLEARDHNRIVPFVAERYSLTEADARKLVEAHWPEALE